MAPGGGPAPGVGARACPPPSGIDDGVLGGIATFCVPTAGDIDREPLEPVGLGVGLRCGVVARPAPPLPPESLLFCPVRSDSGSWVFGVDVCGGLDGGG